MWLVYPPGFDRARNTPVLHSIHGGPARGQRRPLALPLEQPCVRRAGLRGRLRQLPRLERLGYAFLDSITHRWGELELQDVEAGTDWLLKKPWVDRRRVFATGGSYGGYMVAWMNGLVARAATRPTSATPAASTGFRCSPRTPHLVPARTGRELLGRHGQGSRAEPMPLPADEDADAGDHGALDYRVPDGQGLAYYNTLKARGVDAARLLWFPDENHWILKPRNSKLWYGEFFAWLEVPRRRRPGVYPRRTCPVSRPGAAPGEAMLITFLRCVRGR